MMAKGENLLSLKREVNCHPPQEKILSPSSREDIHVRLYTSSYISRTWFYTENDAHLEHRPSQPFVQGTAAVSGTGSLR